MLTAGPPSVAIFVVALSAAGSGTSTRSLAAGGRGSSGARVEILLVATEAIWTSSAAGDFSAETGAGSAGGAFSTTGISVVVACCPAGRGNEASSGCWAAICSVESVEAEAGAAAVSSVRGAVAGARSCGVAAAGNSTRSAASTGVVGSGCAKVTSGAVRHDGLAANSSWAARNSAAAPSPKIRSDIDNTIAATRKRKPGSIAASSALAGILRRLLSRRERGDHKSCPQAANQAHSRIPKTIRNAR